MADELASHPLAAGIRPRYALKLTVRTDPASLATAIAARATPRDTATSATPGSVGKHLASRLLRPPGQRVSLRWELPDGHGFPLLRFPPLAGAVGAPRGGSGGAVRLLRGHC